MVDVKEIKSIEIAPFTLMSSTVQAILAFIAAIIGLALFSIIGAFIPGLGAAVALAGVALIVIWPISAFFFGLMTHFFTTLLYNGLVPRLGGIKLGLEGSDVMEIPIVSLALIVAAIQAIWAFIFGIFLAASITPIIAFLGSSAATQVINNVTNATGASMVTGTNIAAFDVVTALLLIIGLPIAVFIIGFISNALAAIFYNFIATKATKLKLEFAAISGNLFELKSIPVVPAALAAAIVFAIFGLIRGLISLATLSANGNALAGVGSLVGNIIAYFVIYFIIVALGTFFYNWLAPRIGGFKLTLE